MELLRIRVALLITGMLLRVPICQAQQSPPPHRIGIISSTGRLAQGSPTRAAFQQELRSRGYEDGTSVLIDERNATGAYNRLPALLAELISLKVEVIVAADTTAATAAEQATQTIPVVFMAADPIGNRLVTDLSRPGGNLTGVAFIANRQVKQIEIVKEVIPGLSRLAVLADKSYLPVPNEIVRTETAARQAGVQVQVIAAHDPKDFDGAFASMTKWHAQALMVLLSPIFSRTMPEIAAYAIKIKIPMMAPYQESSGALITYQADVLHVSRRLAVFVSEILKGTSPGKLPIETPSNSRLTINLKTAKALELFIPERVIRQADELIR